MENNMISKRFWFTAALLGVLGTSSLCLNLCSAQESASTAPSAAPATSVPSTPVVPKNDAPPSIDEISWTVPESGSIDEYIVFIARVLSTPARPQSFEQAKTLYTKQAAAVGGACDKIMAMQQPDDSQIRRVVETKINAYMRLMFFQIEDKSAELLAIPDQLKAAGREELAKDYLETPRSFLFSAYEARKDFDAFNKLEAKLASKVEEEAENVSGETALTVRHVLEMVKKRDPGKYNSMVEKYSDLLVKAKDPMVVRMGKRLLGEKRFLSLPGSEIQLAGKLLNGSEFNFESYKGKVVLIDFWATWCGPCVGEIPNVKKMYDAYHEKGFDIVGISCDSDKQRLEQFLKDREIPWAQMLDADTNVDECTLCDYYGVNGIPTMVLLGKDGKVISTKARGPELVRLLAEQFGPLPEETPEDN